MYLGAEEPGGLTLARKEQHVLSCVTQSFFTVELSTHEVFSFSTEANDISVFSS